MPRLQLILLLATDKRVKCVSNLETSCDNCLLCPFSLADFDEQEEEQENMLPLGKRRTIPKETPQRDNKNNTLFIQREKDSNILQRKKIVQHAESIKFFV